MADKPRSYTMSPYFHGRFDAVGRKLAMRARTIEELRDGGRQRLGIGRPVCRRALFHAPLILLRPQAQASQIG
jgi:hypothetical protein